MAGGLNRTTLPAITVHEVAPGHFAHGRVMRRASTDVRKTLMSMAFIEGWAHYAEELAIDVGLADDRPLIEIAQLKSALEAATRLLIFLSIHMGRWSFAQAVDRAAELNGWSPERAAQARRAAPSRSGSAAD